MFETAAVLKYLLAQFMVQAIALDPSTLRALGAEVQSPAFGTLDSHEAVFVAAAAAYLEAEAKITEEHDARR